MELEVNAHARIVASLMAQHAEHASRMLIEQDPPRFTYLSACVPRNQPLAFLIFFSFLLMLLLSSVGQSQRPSPGRHSYVLQDCCYDLGRELRHIECLLNLS